MFSMTRCFALDEPGGHDDRTRRARRQHPLGDPLDVDPRGLEDRSGQAHEHPATERDQHVVDEPLAREADEVHAPLVRPDGAAHVRVGDREPEDDGQVDGDEDLGGRVRIEGVEVDHERSERERRRRPAPTAARRSCRSASEVRRRGTAARSRLAFRSQPGRLRRRGSRQPGGRPGSTTAAATAKTSVANQPLVARSGSSSPPRTSCFHSRPLCSRANSRDSSSRSPIRLTATRKASSACEAGGCRAPRSGRGDDPRARRRRGR